MRQILFIIPILQMKKQLSHLPTKTRGGAEIHMKAVWLQSISNDIHDVWL